MPIKVLVVEDDDVIRQLITVNLELEGFEVTTAIDGQEAIDRVLEINPDVITLDVMMPRLDGWATATQLAANPDTAHIKVVLLSARAQDADIQHGQRLGVDAYLTKPFDPDELVETVRRLATEAGSGGSS
jgi:CheY-like chemotaxis protein